MSSGPTRPVLRYHGGKWKVAHWVISHFPAHRLYCESYGGGASVLMRKPRTYSEVYNDLDGEVVNVFRVLRDPDTASELERALALTPYARTEFLAAYGSDGCGPVERARRTIVKSYMGFGSNAIHCATPRGMRTKASTWGSYTGFRTSAKRLGTTPALDWSRYPDQVAAFCARLQGVVIENRDALAVIRQHDSPETLHYVDPPYVHSTRGRRVGYRDEMTDQQHRELADVLHQVVGTVVLSGYPSMLYENLYAGWRRSEVWAHADGAKPSTEVLWISPGAARLELFG